MNYRRGAERDADPDVAESATEERALRIRATKFPCSKKRLRTMFREWPADAWLRRGLSRSGRSPRY